MWDNSINRFIYVCVCVCVCVCVLLVKRVQWGFNYLFSFGSQAAVVQLYVLNQPEGLSCTHTFTLTINTHTLTLTLTHTYTNTHTHTQMHKQNIFKLSIHCSFIRIRFIYTHKHTQCTLTHTHTAFILCHTYTHSI